MRAIIEISPDRRDGRVPLTVIFNSQTRATIEHPTYDPNQSVEFYLRKYERPQEVEVDNNIPVTVTVEKGSLIVSRQEPSPSAIAIDVTLKKHVKVYAYPIGGIHLLAPNDGIKKYPFQQISVRAEK